MQKRIKREGDAYSKLVQAMRQIGRNETSTILFGTITSAPPNIKMQLDNIPIEFDKDDIYVAEHLTAHERIANITSPVTSSSMSTNGYQPHVHDISHITMERAVIQFTDELKEGERVIVECDDENMKYIILDRVVSYK